MKNRSSLRSPTQQLFQAVYRSRWRLKPGLHPSAPIPRRTAPGPVLTKNRDR